MERVEEAGGAAERITQYSIKSSSDILTGEIYSLMERGID